tara:strand:+ start:3877 stop:4119 length:243 start_codon:yes stop_codon:yes gene_type:complete
MEMTKQIMDALLAKYEADKMRAFANLQNYLTNPAGIGEHPDIVAECDKLVSDIDDAIGKIDTLRQLFSSGDQGEQKEGNE